VRVVIRYDTGDGWQERRIGPRALVGWELQTKQRMSDLSNGFGVGDMATMLYEQMRADGDAPPTRQALLDSLVDLEPVRPDDPPQPDEDQPSELSSNSHSLADSP
jgi:hypothetical protein